MKRLEDLCRHGKKLLVSLESDGHFSVAEVRDDGTPLREMVPGGEEVSIGTGVDLEAALDDLLDRGAMPVVDIDEGVAG